MLDLLLLWDSVLDDPLFTVDPFWDEPLRIQALTGLFAFLAFLWAVRWLQAYLAIRRVKERYELEDRLRAVETGLAASAKAWIREA